MISTKCDNDLSSDCNRESLLELLREGEHSFNHELTIEHLEQCAACQQAYDDMAAGKHDWETAREALRTNDWPTLDEDQAQRWQVYPELDRYAVGWTEKMAAQLLSPPSHPEMLGRIGRFEVERLIGAGGMGVVFKAHDTELNRQVAIKLLAPYLAGSGPARKRFAREARAAAAIVHDHVVPIHNVEAEREVPFLVMQYIAGESLQARIDRQGSLDLCEVLRIGMQVASGLAAAHHQGLVHRDIKPSNILLEPTVERAFITDFGLARAADDASLTHTGFHPGTPQYMSPEQAAGDSVDARSDLFSLGSVLYTMCTGRAPFRAETSLGVLRRIADGQPRPIQETNPNVPVWLCQLIDRLMAKAPGDRYASAAEVALLLEQCLAHVQQPTTTALPLELQPAIHGSNRNTNRIAKWIGGFAAALLVLFGGTLIVLETNKGTLRIESNSQANVPIRITQDGKTVEHLNIDKNGSSTRLRAGDYIVEIEGEHSNIEIVDGKVTIRRGDTWIAKIETSPVTNPSVPTNKQNTVSAVQDQMWPPLADAVGKFNLDYRDELEVANCSPLTEAEVLTAIGWKAEHNQLAPEKSIVSGRFSQNGMPIPWKFVKGIESRPGTASNVATKPQTSKSFNIVIINEQLGVSIPIRRQYVSPPTQFLTPSELSKDEKARPLAAAIETFNNSNNTIDGKRQPPITLNEVLGAITDWPNRRSEADIDDATFENFQRIARTHRMPADASFEVISSFGTAKDNTYYIWSVRILMPQVAKPGWTYAFEIRNQFVGMQKTPEAEIQWGTPGDNGLQAGVRFNPGQKTYIDGQEIEVEFAYRSITGKAIPANVPNFFSFNKIIVEDSKGGIQQFGDTQNDIVGGWMRSSIDENHGYSTYRKKIRFFSFRGGPLRFNPNETRVLPGGVGPAKRTMSQLVPLTTNQPSKIYFIVPNFGDNSNHPLTTGQVEIELSEEEANPSMGGGGPGTPSSFGGAGTPSSPETSSGSPEVPSSSGGSPSEPSVDDLFGAFGGGTDPGTPSSPNATGGGPLGSDTPVLDKVQSLSSSLALLQRFQRSDNSIDQVVQQFNNIHDSILDASGCSPLTKEELLSAIQWKIDKDEVDAETIASLDMLLTAGEIPDSWQLTSGPVINKKTSYVLHCHITLENSKLDKHIEIRRQMMFPSEGYQDISEPPADSDWRPLQAAIDDFNSAHKELDGKHQMPLSRREVLATIVDWLHRREPGVDVGTFDKFQKIAASHHVPSDAQFVLLPNLSSDAHDFRVWSVRLVVPQTNGFPLSLEIRRQFLSHTTAKPIHWGIPGENGLQAGFRIVPQQKTYANNQMVDIEFYYRSTNKKEIPSRIPNDFKYKIASVSYDKASIGYVDTTLNIKQLVASGRPEMIGDNPIVFKGTKLKLRSPSTISFDVPDLVDGADGLLETGEAKIELSEEGAVSGNGPGTPNPSGSSSRGPGPGTPSSPNVSGNGPTRPSYNSIDQIVQVFNDGHVHSLERSRCSPISKEEVLSALSWKIDKGEIDSETLASFDTLLTTGQIPYTWQLRGEQNFLNYFYDKIGLYHIVLENEALKKQIEIRRQMMWPPKQYHEISEPTMDPNWRPLQAAIDAFNQAHHELGNTQPTPLTLDEVIAGIVNSLIHQEPKDDSGMFNVLQRIAASHHIPSDAQLVVSPYLVLNGKEYRVWSVNLLVPQSVGPNSIEIRRQFLSVVDKPHAQTIHWGKPGENGLQAGFRLNPAQTIYSDKQDVEVEFFYRSANNKPIPTTVPNDAFFLYKLSVTQNDMKHLAIHETQKIIGSSRVESVSETPLTFRGTKLMMLAPDGKELLSRYTEDGRKPLQLRLNKPGSIYFEVPNLGKDATGSLRTGEIQIELVRESNSPDDISEPVRPAGAFIDLRGNYALPKVPADVVSPLLEKLQGTWEITKISDEGTDSLPLFKDRQASINIDKGLLRVQGTAAKDGQNIEIPMALHLPQSQGQQQVNVLFDPNDTERPCWLPGIIEVEGDTLRFCCRCDCGATEEQRPKHFAGGKNIWFYEAKRKQPDDKPLDE